MPEYRFNPAPGWPEFDSDWMPPQGWRPNPEWPPAPEGWQYWVEVRDPYQPPADHVVSAHNSPVERWKAQPATPKVNISPRVENFNGIPVIYSRQQQGRSVIVYSLGIFAAFLVGILPTLLGYPNLLSSIFIILFILFLGQAIYFTKSPNYFWRL